MGTTKSELFSTTDNELAKYAKALAHPARIAILKILFMRKQCVCGDIVEELPLAQSTISQHLKELKASGLIQGEIEGPSVCYCINMKSWLKIRKTLSDFWIIIRMIRKIVAKLKPFIVILRFRNKHEYENANDLKQIVREKYAQIALQSKETNQSSCCGSGGCSTEVYNIMTEDYTALKGYQEEADLGLGCGLPTEFAKIKEGNVVIDLGSGAGNDCFIARDQTGPTGKVLGIDFTVEMIEKARINAQNLGYSNVEFLLGDIEDMPVKDNFADVIVSNCVLNLVPDKAKVFKEIYRVLKPGGHFSISDVVLQGDLPDKVKDQAEMYAGCVSGAIQQGEYLEYIKKTGFENLEIQKLRPIEIPLDILSQYLGEEDLKRYQNKEFGIYSISVFAEKPKVKSGCCAPGCCN
ncbi:MAG: arsenite methyltransferase [Saprospiraceae bacterium]|nr:arsenite methyltransferase [Saprospiraceae bacterium]